MTRNQLLMCMESDTEIEKKIEKKVPRQEQNIIKKSNFKGKRLKYYLKKQLANGVICMGKVPKDAVGKIIN
ncbi:hypothetical protein PQ692_14680 (plasmid) [Thermoanaerobacterium thermosaccharolyticum]|uniref:hypothetical protein n=1 Tax=Thermoanaerobacterium thermosaccharolyticum TaxID=1517 RepID=UPI003DAA12DC